MSGSPRDPGADPGAAAGRRRTFEIEADSDVRLDLLLASHLDVSRTQAATLIAEGRVLVSGRREKASYKPRAGERVDVELPPPAERRAVAAEAIALVIAYEDDDVLVVDKPAGMVVHPAPGNWTVTLVNALKGRGARRRPRRRRHEVARPLPPLAPLRPARRPR